ncbi:MAG TPA: hypothetical protein VJ549_03305 [Geothrix sp.]|nr:hypothetical protein [Geothrix sp.]
MDDWREWIRDRSALLIAMALAVVGGAWWWEGRAVTHPAGVLVAADPIQREPDSPASWTFKHHRITPLAHFEIRARVLSTERYRFDRASELSPVDFALGWGPMSDSLVLKAFTIRQQDRWYFWSTEIPVPASEVISHSANMHMIPANDSVARHLLAVRTGQLVELCGQLVRVDGEDGWHWVSSLSRTDTGDGSCEVIWVESVRATDR